MKRGLASMQLSHELYESSWSCHSVFRLFPCRIMKFLGPTALLIFYYHTNRFDLSNMRWHLLFFGLLQLYEIYNHIARENVQTSALR